MIPLMPAAGYEPKGAFLVDPDTQKVLLELETTKKIPDWDGIASHIGKDIHHALPQRDYQYHYESEFH